MSSAWWWRESGPQKRHGGSQNAIRKPAGGQRTTPGLAARCAGTYKQGLYARRSAERVRQGDELADREAKQPKGEDAA